MFWVIDIFSKDMSKDSLMSLMVHTVHKSNFFEQATLIRIHVN